QGRAGWQADGREAHGTDRRPDRRRAPRRLRHHDEADQELALHRHVPRLRRVAEELARDSGDVPAHRHRRRREEGDRLPRHASVTAGAAIVLEGVHKSFENGRVQALRDVSFTVEPGELVALTGSSGSGKSTILNLVGALDVPDDGTITVAG